MTSSNGLRKPKNKEVLIFIAISFGFWLIYRFLIITRFSYVVDFILIFLMGVTTLLLTQKLTEVRHSSQG